MENSASNSGEEENQYLNMIIQSNIKKNVSASKDKSDKGNYKLNLSMDLMKNGINCIDI